jgi:hypothetical protein
MPLWLEIRCSGIVQLMINERFEGMDVRKLNCLVALMLDID